MDRTTTFKNRRSKFPNRRKITILEQNANVIKADIEFADEPEEQGTPINAEMLNDFKNEIYNAVDTANNAESTANAAQSLSSSANQTASSALSSANEALQKSNAADTLSKQTQQKVNELSAQIIDKQGTKVTVGGSYKESFDADTKLDKSIFDAYKSTKVMVGGNFVTDFNADTKLDKSVFDALKITKVAYDSATDTFTF